MKRSYSVDSDCILPLGETEFVYGSDGLYFHTQGDFRLVKKACFIAGCHYPFSSPCTAARFIIDQCDSEEGAQAHLKALAKHFKMPEIPPSPPFEHLAVNGGHLTDPVWRGDLDLFDQMCDVSVHDAAKKAYLYSQRVRSKKARTDKALEKREIYTIKTSGEITLTTMPAAVARLRRLYGYDLKCKVSPGGFMAIYAGDPNKPINKLVMRLLRQYDNTVPLEVAGECIIVTTRRVEVRV